MGDMLHQFGKIFLILGAVFLVVGLILYFRPTIPFIGKLPLDIKIERPNIKIYFPLGTSIALSLILTIILYFLSKIFR